jgi:FkbM family methyltransferase
MKLRWRDSFLNSLHRNNVALQFYAMCRNIPILGWVLHKAATFAYPRGSRVWMPIRAGAGIGIWMNLDCRFETDYASGNYEPMIEALLLSGLKPGGVFYDVGAHIGLFSLIAAQVVGKSGLVFAFEADPENAERIREHSERNRLPQICVIPCAVWSTPGRIAFERASANSSRNQGAVTSNPSLERANTIVVEAVNLDAFSKAHLPPTMIKIDVEGGEAAVLAGSQETIRLNAPILICEVHDKKAAEHIIPWLTSSNYAFDWVEVHGGFPRHLWATKDSFSEK